MSGPSFRSILSARDDGPNFSWNLGNSPPELATLPIFPCIS
jgi:hypothetical protein